MKYHSTLKEPHCTKASRPCMGSFLDITLYDALGESPLQALEATFAEVDRLENLLSPFKPESELSWLNREAAYGPIQVSPELFSLVRHGLFLHWFTRGALGITMGPLMRLWGFRSQKGCHTTPTTEQIHETLTLADHQNVVMDGDHMTIHYLQKGIEIEFGAIGKGYAIDRAIQTLTSYGVSQALASFGSSIYGLGAPPGQKGWRVAVRNPRDTVQALDVLLLRDAAMATSGNYEQSVWLDGRRYGHILDPRSGYPATGIDSVSVIAPTAFLADAFSTAAFVLGSQSGSKFLEKQPHVEGLILHGKNQESPLTIQTNGWRAHFEKAQPVGRVTRRQFLETFLAVLGCLFMNLPLSHAIVYARPEEALKRLMPQAERFQGERVTLTNEQKEKAQKLLGNKIRKNTYPFWIGRKGYTPVGYGVRLNVVGKERPITFMVVVNPDGRAQGVEVLRYRESQGSEIRSKRFMRQFVGKSLSSPLKLGRDIDAISGASLSSRSTTYAVKKALALVEVVYGNRRKESP